jgi:hypothetical protein
MNLLVIKNGMKSKCYEKHSHKESHNYNHNYNYISINIDLNRSQILVMNQILVILLYVSQQLLVKQLVFNVFKPVKQQNHRLKYFN